MRTRLRVVAVVAASGWSLGCSDGTAAPSGGDKPAAQTPAKPTPTVVRLAIAPDSASLLLSSGFQFAAYKILSDSSRLPVTATWISSNDQVLTINSANGYAVAVGQGLATVTARIDGLSVASFVTVLGPKGMGASDALVIDGFSMIEFQYPSAPGRWFYAPQMRAHAAPGHTASVLTLKFSIPGLGNAPPFGCGAAISVTPRDLFGEVYGDWLLTIDETDRRASGNAATATITFVDDAGIESTRLITGPVVPGGLPTSYSGGANGGACFHGYGSTG